MDLYDLASGKMIRSMEWSPKYPKMDAFLQEISLMERKVDEECRLKRMEKSL